MLKKFDQIETAGIRKQQRVFGSCFVLIPMRRRPNKKPKLDAQRGVVELGGILTINHADSDLDKNTRIDRAGSKRSMSFMNVSTKTIHLNILKCDLVWEPLQFDQVWDVEKQQMYEILKPMATNGSDLDLHLNEIDGAYSVTS